MADRDPVVDSSADLTEQLTRKVSRQATQLRNLGRELSRCVDIIGMSRATKRREIKSDPKGADYLNSRERFEDMEQVVKSRDDEITRLEGLTQSNERHHKRDGKKILRLESEVLMMKAQAGASMHALRLTAKSRNSTADRKLITKLRCEVDSLKGHIIRCHARLDVASMIEGTVTSILPTFEDRYNAQPITSICADARHHVAPLTANWIEPDPEPCGAVITIEKSTSSVVQYADEIGIDIGATFTADSLEDEVKYFEDSAAEFYNYYAAASTIDSSSGFSPSLADENSQVMERHDKLISYVSIPANLVLQHNHGIPADFMQRSRRPYTTSAPPVLPTETAPTPSEGVGSTDNGSDPSALKVIRPAKGSIMSTGESIEHVVGGCGVAAHGCEGVPSLQRKSKGRRGAGGKDASKVSSTLYEATSAPSPCAGPSSSLHGPALPDTSQGNVCCLAERALLCDESARLRPLQVILTQLTKDLQIFNDSIKQQQLINIEATVQNCTTSSPFNQVTAKPIPYNCVARGYTNIYKKGVKCAVESKDVAPYGTRASSRCFSSRYNHNQFDGPLPVLPLPGTEHSSPITQSKWHGFWVEIPSIRHLSAPLHDMLQSLVQALRCSEDDYAELKSSLSIATPQAMNLPSVETREKTPGAEELVRSTDPLGMPVTHDPVTQQTANEVSAGPGVEKFVRGDSIDLFCEKKIVEASAPDLDSVKCPNEGLSKMSPALCTGGECCAARSVGINPKEVQGVQCAHVDSVLVDGISVSGYIDLDRDCGGRKIAPGNSPKPSKSDRNASSLLQERSLTHVVPVIANQSVSPVEAVTLELHRKQEEVSVLLSLLDAARCQAEAYRKKCDSLAALVYRMRQREISKAEVCMHLKSTLQRELAHAQYGARRTSTLAAPEGPQNTFKMEMQGIGDVLPSYRICSSGSHLHLHPCSSPSPSPIRTHETRKSEYFVSYQHFSGQNFINPSDIACLSTPSLSHSRTPPVSGTPAQRTLNSNINSYTNSNSTSTLSTPDISPESANWESFEKGETEGEGESEEEGESECEVEVEGESEGQSEVEGEKEEGEGVRNRCMTMTPETENSFSSSASSAHNDHKGVHYTADGVTNERLSRAEWDGLHDIAGTLAQHGRDILRATLYESRKPPDAPSSATGTPCKSNNTGSPPIILKTKMCNSLTKIGDFDSPTKTRKSDRIEHNSGFNTPVKSKSHFPHFPPVPSEIHVCGMGLADSPKGRAGIRIRPSTEPYMNEDTDIPSQLLNLRIRKAENLFAHMRYEISSNQI